MADVVDDVEKEEEVQEIVREIRDGIFVVVGNQAITKSDIVNEIKVILILNNISYSDDRRQELQEMAIKASVKRAIKEAELRKYNFLEYSKKGKLWVDKTHGIKTVTDTLYDYYRKIGLSC